MTNAVRTVEGLVRRCVRTFDEPDERTCDCVWTDRVTGKVVMRYDAADPANTSAAYGAVPDSDVFARKGLDIDEEVEISRCGIYVPPGEVEAHKWRKEALAQREREEAAARDLFEFLGNAACADFSFDRYREGERLILRPALEARGFTNVAFYMGEQDSFGPLSRGCVAYAASGERVRFYYG